MSEFSDSCHLRTKLRDDAVQLLIASKVPGYVFDEAAGWVSFVFPVGSQLGLVDNLACVVAANASLLVRYEYAEDHGCAVTVYDRTERVADLEVSFESSKPGRFDRDAFIDRGLVTAKAGAEIERWVRDVRRDLGSLVVAASLGLPRHEWFAYKYVDRRHRDADRLDCIAVRGDGTMSGDDDATPVAPPPVDGGPLFEFAMAFVGNSTERETSPPRARFAAHDRGQPSAALSSRALTASRARASYLDRITPR
ncbi:MAG: hypothetical protein ABI467_03140 [Kofleriaceae bacterium]